MTDKPDASDHGTETDVIPNPLGGVCVCMCVGLHTHTHKRVIINYNDNCELSQISTTTSIGNEISKYMYNERLVYTKLKKAPLFAQHYRSSLRQRPHYLHNCGSSG